MPRNPRAAILGFGREGKSVLRFLRPTKQYRNAAIEIRDQAQDKKYLRNLERFDVIFRSPGVPYTLPQIQRAIKSGVKFSSATKLFFEHFHGRIIGITGSKGKGTVATLLYRILRRAGKKVALAGNIGKPALDLLPRTDKNTLVILELSSFQLQDLRQSPHIAVVLDVFPEHLDAHRSTKEYFAAKTSICRFQTKKDAMFYFADNARSARIARNGSGKKFGLRVPEISERNAAMAAAVTRYLGVKKSIVAAAIKSFRGLPHRLEFVREIRGVKFYNDSAATNPHATVFALAHFKEPVILIAGGKDKRLDCAPLARTIRRTPNVKAVILLGENKKKIRAALQGIMNHELRIREAKTLHSAIEIAYRFAKTLVTSGYWLNTVVLFSPGAASFDMFRDYTDRGEAFKKVVRNLTMR